MTNNPYKPPTSILNDKNTTFKKPGAVWTVFFFLLIAFVAIRLISDIFLYKELAGKPAQFFDWLPTIIKTIGVHGFIFYKKILFRRFWRIFLPLVMIWDLFLIFYSISYNPLTIAVLIFIVLVLYGPAYYGIFRYTSKNNPVWKDN